MTGEEGVSGEEWEVRVGGIGADGESGGAGRTELLGYARVVGREAIRTEDREV